LFLHLELSTHSYHFYLVIRYNWKLPFNASSSWEAFNAAGIDGLKTVGYCGAVAADNFVFFVPCSNEFSGQGFHSEVLRYDSSKPFGAQSSWSAFDISSTIGAVSGMGYAIPRMSFTLMLYDPLTRRRTQISRGNPCWTPYLFYPIPWRHLIFSWNRCSLRYPQGSEG
jgi:hypothetical protein